MFLFLNASSGGSFLRALSIVLFVTGLLYLAICGVLWKTFWRNMPCHFRKIAIGTVLVRVCLLWEVFSSLEHLLSITIIGPFD